MGGTTSGAHYCGQVLDPFTGPVIESRIFYWGGTVRGFGSEYGSSWNAPSPSSPTLLHGVAGVPSTRRERVYPVSGRRSTLRGSRGVEGRGGTSE